MRELQKRIMAISTGIYNMGSNGSSYLKGVKCALSLMGICSDHISYPYRKSGNTERAIIRNNLINLGVDIANP